MTRQAPVLTIDIDARMFDVFLTDAGEFYALFDAERIQAPTKKALMEKLKKLVRTRGRVTVPATLVEVDTDRKIKVTQITLTGLHGRTRAALYVEDRTPTTTHTVYYNNVYRRLTGEEIAVAVALHRTYKQAEQAWEAWQEKNAIDPTAVLREAQETALAGKAEEVVP